MRKLVIGAVATAIVAGVIIVKKINDDRKTIDVDYDENGVTIAERETFKEAAIRKVNEILSWVSNNPDKVESVTSIVSTLSVVIGIVTGIVELYSSLKSAKDKTNEKILNELTEIHLCLDSSNSCTVYDF